MGIKLKKFKVGDLVSVDHIENQLIVAVTPPIKAGIVMKKMKTKDFYIVYSRGKYHTNVYADWMRKLQ